MSAIIQKDSCYFSHDANAKDDSKCMLMIDQMGLEGYGIFWILIETLREQKDYKYPLSLVPSLARKYNTTQAKMETVIIAYNLFETDKDSLFFSRSLNRRMHFFETKKLQQIEAGKKGVEAKKAKAQKQIEELSGNDSINRPSTVPKTIKEKETKLNQIKLNETLSAESESAKRDVLQNFKTFKSHFIQKNTGIAFHTQGIGYEPNTEFKINTSGYIENLKIKKMVTPEEAFKIWEFLYQYYKSQHTQKIV